MFILLIPHQFGINITSISCRWLELFCSQKVQHFLIIHYQISYTTHSIVNFQYISVVPKQFEVFGAGTTRIQKISKSLFEIGHITNLKCHLNNTLNSIVMDRLIFDEFRLILPNECQITMHNYHLAKNIIWKSTNSIY